MANLETLRHSTSHVLASAIKEIYPKAKLAIGPAIEDGFYYDFDDLKITEQDLILIEKKMQQIIDKKLPFKKLNKTYSEAKELLKNEPYKLELLEELKKEKKPITFYQHGNFIDLCAGPHLTNTSEIKAFKLLRLAGAYWKGDSKNKMLTRIYGIAFPSKKELDDYLKLLEEAEKRNHRKLGRELDLFSFHEEAPGMPFIHPKGMIVWNELLDLWRKEHKKAGYVEVKTPIILNEKLWHQSGHWDHYKENMYFTKIDNLDYAVKPMNCPGGMLIYLTKLHSYKEFPLRVAEVGLVHRHELSGVLNGLFRVRCFHQDDAHLFVTEEQLADELKNLLKLTDHFYKDIFGFDYHVELSTRPEKAMGDPKLWKLAEQKLEKSLKELKLPYKVNPGDGAFYGPKIDFHIKDALGRTWQCATIQLDFQMPERFDLTYDGADGKKHRTIMIHRTIYGSLERFIGILVEHYAGSFPLWLNPVQVSLLTFTDRNKDYAKKILEKLTENNIRVELDDRNETVNKKVFDAQSQKVPLILVVGDKEEKNNTIAVRTRDGKTHFNIELNSFIEQVLKNIHQKSEFFSFK